MAEKAYDRALTIDKEVCIGCSHCMKVCPTEALRVSGGKAHIHPQWCIDCGECYRECPTSAIKVMDDDFNDIFNYRHRILLVPFIFFAQFDPDVGRQRIIDIIGSLGFTEICAVEQGVEALVPEIRKYVRSEGEKPVISSYCPAVVRLIQVRFPSLVGNIMRLLPPIEVAARYYKGRYAEEGVEEKDIGIFYLTPCIAKIAAVKSPVGGYVSPVTGVINMDYLYNKVMLAHKQKEVLPGDMKVNGELSSKGVLWTTSGGEAANIPGRTLAVDGVNNVIDFLEMLEDGNIEGVDFLEIRTCDQSCAGGILARRNRFLAAEMLGDYSKTLPARAGIAKEYRRLRAAGIRTGEVEPRQMVKYDRDITVALTKMERARELRKLLPDIDCGACGAPSCEALAEDIANGRAEINACIFQRTTYEKRGELSIADEVAIMEKIWGRNRFNIKKDFT